MVVLNMLLFGVAVLLSVPVLVLALEVVSATVFGARVGEPGKKSGPRPRLAVLVPAHNESTGILPTLADISAQLTPGDRLMVVADNCSDDTAEVAREAGAEVVERHCPEQRGKGYALDFGLRHLAFDPPEVVVMVDADCRLGESSLATLAMCSATSGRPAQARYVMRVPDDAAVNQPVAAFAWIVKTYVRPLGLSALGLPCQLMGTGMALPWRAAGAVDLASGNLVEDMKLGLDLGRLGCPAMFCPQARVESVFPTSADATLTQRRRWEVGSLRIIRDEVPGALLQATRRRDIALLALGLDALVPPITLLGGLLLIALAVTGGLALLGASPAAPLELALALGLMVASLFLAWARFGRAVLSARDAIPFIAFLLQKLQVYKPLSTNQKTGWTRTDRD